MKNNKVTSRMLAEVSASECARFRHLIKGTPDQEKSVDILAITQGREVTSKAREIILQEKQTILPAGKWNFKLPIEDEDMEAICHFFKKNESGNIDIAIINSSSVSKNSKKFKQKMKEIMNDVTAQFVILSSLGQKIDNVFLGMLNERAYGPSDPNLFEITDVTKCVRERAHRMKKELDALLSAQASDMPKQKMCSACKKCKFLKNCFPIYEEKHTIRNIPRLSDEDFVDLHNAGIQDVAARFKYIAKQDSASHEAKMQDMKAEIKRVANWTPNENRLRHMHSWIHNHHFIYEKSKMLKKFRNAGQDVYFLDFETVSPAVPIFETHAPYTRIPFQFSLHKAKMENGRYEITKHEDFLCLGNDDPTKAFLEALIGALGDNSCKIMVYSNFEEVTLNMAIEPNRLAEYSHDVSQIKDRFIDLMKIVEKHLAHPGQKGSVSIKKVLPALVKSDTLSYKNSKIQDGQQASAIWLDVRKEMMPRQDAEEALREYCELDTKAMVLVANEMLDMAEKNS